MAPSNCLREPACMRCCVWDVAHSTNTVQGTEREIRFLGRCTGFPCGGPQTAARIDEHSGNHRYLDLRWHHFRYCLHVTSWLFHQLRGALCGWVAGSRSLDVHTLLPFVFFHLTMRVSHTVMARFRSLPKLDIGMASRNTRVKVKCDSGPISAVAYS